MSKNIQKPTKTRKLSLVRVGIAIVVLGGIIYASFFSAALLQTKKNQKAAKPWFGAYVDVTATPTYQFQQMGGTQSKDAVLAFIVSSSSDVCTPSWGTVYTIQQANSALDLDTRIARLQEQGGSVAVSFGGRDHSELALGCSDPAKLLSAYQTVIDHYQVDTIDLDLEGASLSDADSQIRRATTLAKLQSQRRADGKNLAVWVTLPVSPSGLTEEGTTAIANLLSHGLDITGINIMTMDYGSSLTPDEGMLAASESALMETQHQLGILYKHSGIYLNDAALWAKIGATPMIGQNDDANEIFTLDDATALNTYALSKGIGRLSMWSANRDATCGSNYIDIHIVSDGCSGIKEDQTTFAQALGQGFTGSITSNAQAITLASKPSQADTAPDDPAKSPYPIWSSTAAYLANTKIVWHHYIYEAKWWTSGDIPDNPVLQSWQTPWELIGPVLAGQTPIPQPTLPAGTYPNWSGTAIYNAGQRVLLNGIPYQAKWWTQGDSPDASRSDPNGSPWVTLTNTQIQQILATLPSSAPTPTVAKKK